MSQEEHQDSKLDSRSGPGRAKAELFDVFEAIKETPTETSDSVALDFHNCEFI